MYRDADKVEAMHRSMRWMLGFLVVALVAIAATASYWKHFYGGRDSASTKTTVPPAPAHPEPSSTVESLPITSGDTLSDLLIRAGFTPNTTAEIVSTIREKFDVRKLRSGSQLQLVRLRSGAFDSLEYLIDPDHKLRLSQTNDGYAAEILEVPGTLRIVPVCSTLRGSLFESIESSGERPDLAIQMAEIFAWDLDFYTDSREGDEFCVLVEKKEYSNGQPPSYGRILAAKYTNSDTTYDAFLFPDADGKERFYSHDGRSLQSAFLRSPMKFEARISSGFSRHRFHPVLKKYRPHLGTDYAAPAGTPVQAVATGRVVFSGRSGGAGNLIRIQHANGYETFYMHLSRRFVRNGQHVQQGQRIGLVGATGLATGPHLDFRIRRNGSFVNFEGLKLPRETRIAAAKTDEFASTRERCIALMESGLASAPDSVASGI